MDKAQKLHREMLQHAEAGDHEQVVTVAQRYLARFERSPDPTARALTAGVKVTRLSSQAHLAPAGALQSCDELFAEYHNVAEAEGPVVAAAALRIKIELLLQAGETSAVLAVVAQLQSFFDALPHTAEAIQPADRRKQGTDPRPTEPGRGQFAAERPGTPLRNH